MRVRTEQACLMREMTRSGQSPKTRESLEQEKYSAYTRGVMRNASRRSDLELTTC